MLPASLRIGSAAAVVVLALAALVLQARGGVLARPPRTGRAVALGAWAIAGDLSLNTLANLASASAAERFLAGPTAVMAALAVVVARHGTSPRTGPGAHVLDGDRGRPDRDAGAPTVTRPR